MQEDDHGDAIKVIEHRKADLINWLNLYMSDKSVEEAGGLRNQKRILREIQDTFNEKLWTDSRGLIHEVQIIEWFIQ